MSTAIALRAALPKEAALLSQLAMRSKAHWGYSAEFMAACNDELSWSNRELASADFSFTVAERAANIVGFYATKKLTPDSFDLEALFVEPDEIGSGVGRTLVQHAITALQASGARILSIQGDPNAESFYVAAGARKVGTRPSGSIPGRELPLFEISLNTG